MAVAIPERIKEKLLNEILAMYAEGEVSAGRAAETLGISRAALYQRLAEKKIPLPEKLNESILKELKKMKNRKG